MEFMAEKSSRKLSEIIDSVWQNAVLDREVYKDDYKGNLRRVTNLIDWLSWKETQFEETGQYYFLF